MQNIFIPTKNRVENSTLLKFAESENENVFVVVEPQEHQQYKNRFTNFQYIILPENNGGITYVRNYIKEYSESLGMQNYWQLDDDITGFFYREGTKLIRGGFGILHKAAVEFKDAGFALGGLEYRQFAWSASKNFVINSFCDSCVFVDNTKTIGMRYREYLEGKEDRDFAMQVIASGEKTARTTLFAFSAPANGLSLIHI